MRGNLQSVAPDGEGAAGTAPPVALRRIQRLSYLLDNSIPLPGLGYRVGWDAVLGLIPGAGDMVGTLLSGYIILEAARLGASRATLLRMVFNVAVEAVVGAVPLLGDLFDATWKANARNMQLLGEQAHTPVRAHRSNRRFARLLVGGLVLLVLGVAAAGVWLTAVLLRML